MSNIQIYKKPQLAILSEENKIRSYNEVERRAISSKIVMELLVKLGVGKNSNEEHHLEAIKYISNNKEFAPKEYAKAFDLVINGTIKDDRFDLFQQLNCLIIGKVMNLYKRHKFEVLKIYKQKLQMDHSKQKSLTPAENKELFFATLEDEFKSFKESGTINEMRNWLFDELIKFNVDVDGPTKKVVWKHSIKEIRDIQSRLFKRDKYDNETLHSKAVVIYKRKLIETIFKKFINYEQLLNKLK